MSTVVGAETVGAGDAGTVGAGGLATVKGAMTNGAPPGDAVVEGAVCLGLGAVPEPTE